MRESVTQLEIDQRVFDRYDEHIDPGTQHGFHNNSTPRYQEAAAKLAWERTVGFFKTNLA